MNPNLVTLYQSPFPKRRIGRWCDGGYVIADVPDLKYDALFAGGVCDDISFEEGFIEYQQTKLPVFAFDGTVTELPHSKFQSQIQFIRKNIGEFESDEYTNLHSLFLLHSIKFESPNIFVKMDIEGGEVDWIRSLKPEHMNSISQFVMEFHNPFGTNEIKMFEKINETHLLIHLHPNNVGGSRIHNGVYFPNIFECTYLHKRFFNGTATLNQDYIPNDMLDSQNIRQKEDIWMSHPPFVHFDKFIRNL